MINVYFYKTTTDDSSELSKIMRKMVETLVEKEGVSLEKKVPIKVHFGEKGNTTYIKAPTYEGVLDYFEEEGVESAFIETNVLYRGSRTNATEHTALAKEHGFIRVPIIIADGEIGEAIWEVPINGKIFDKAYLGKAYGDYDQLLVVAHFKGHSQAGFGGALKQLAMGCASRRGKLAQHSTISPLVNEEKCVSCGICAGACDYNAITIDPVAKIDSDKCVGCAGCIAVCPVEAIRNAWDAEDFLYRVAEYAYAAGKDKKSLYVNLLFNVTELCDCVGKPMDLVAENIGVFVSTDPVALDTACLDALQNNHSEKLFDDGRETLKYVEELGLGQREYNLVEVN